MSALEQELVSVERAIPMRRVWAMPNKNTFDIPPIRALVRGYLNQSKVSVDPFARDKRWATYTNDLNPNTTAESHMDAEEFLYTLRDEGILCDLAILDPPYSPRQISECYKAAGVSVGMADTQNAALYSRVRHALSQVLKPDAVVISCGWNSSGMGKNYGMETIEMLIVCHGSAHNDTICVVERAAPNNQMEML